MNTPYKMKSPTLMAGTKGAPIQAKFNDSPTNKPKKKKTLGEWFKSTKLSKDLNKAGDIIRGDVDKIKKGFESPNLNPHTGEKESRASRSVGNAKRDLNRIKRKVENKKSKFDNKVKNNLTNLGNRLFKRKTK